MALTVPKAELTGVFLESLAYGFVIPCLTISYTDILSRCIPDGIQSVYVCAKEETLSTK